MANHDQDSEHETSFSATQAEQYERFLNHQDLFIDTLCFVSTPTSLTAGWYYELWSKAAETPALEQKEAQWNADAEDPSGYGWAI